MNLAQHMPATAQAHLERLLATCPDPDCALRYLNSLNERHPALVERLTPKVLHYFITVFSYSHFLSEEVLQNPSWVESVSDMDRLLSPEEYTERLEAFLTNNGGELSALSLALFRRQQILRILLRDVLGFCSLAEVTEELSNLADAILNVAYAHIRAELIGRHGIPEYQDEIGTLRECGMAVIALGKLGGRELNYSSDIDLMFIYTANGETSGPDSISNKEFYKKVANQYTQLLSTYTSEGMCYRVDLRLRPDGSLGEVCISLEGAEKYYQNRARDWELQMLIKARVAAGDVETGRELLDSVQPLIYSTTLDFRAIEAVSVTRERISEKLNSRRGKATGFDVKLAPGGIRDIEFLVQCLQRLHGARVPWVRHGGTMLALARLSDKDLLSASEYGRLASAYRFLRNLEHRLQLVDDRQTHALPVDSRNLDLLAARMPVQHITSAPSGAKLLNQPNAHLEAVQEIYERVIHAQKPSRYSHYVHQQSTVTQVEEIPVLPESGATNLMRFLTQAAPGLARVLADNELHRGLRPFEMFMEKVLLRGDLLEILDTEPSISRHVLEIFEYSPYFADELLRVPELIELLRDLIPASPDASRSNPSDLRLFFRREMFRIQAASICLRVPVFQTLQQTSDLADAAIAAAYNLAVKQTVETHPPANHSYEPDRQLMVIALGRLGLREFDLSSDADLLFVLPDEDAAEQMFWTRVAGSLIDLITAYTSSGVMFAVDTRLRPNGSAGALVQLENSYKDYFEKGAEAWEGIAYMKARGVAGDLDRTTMFLNTLQKIDWRHYGQSGRSKYDLRQMRAKLEKEIGATNPLKAGLGGFYDLDFLLLYLRLKGAGIFFKVLNTPERIDIIEAMGHLERGDADFLRDAATFYRAIDHAMRIYSGHAEGKLPASETHLSAVTELAHRWCPEHLNQIPLPDQLAAIRTRAREIFDQVFA